MLLIYLQPHHLYTLKHSGLPQTSLPPPVAACLGFSLPLLFSAHQPHALQNKTHPCFPSTGRDNSWLSPPLQLRAPLHPPSPVSSISLSRWKSLQAKVYPLLSHLHTRKRSICSTSTAAVACPPSFLQLARGQGEEKGGWGRGNSPFSAGSPLPRIACLQLLTCFSLPACHLLFPHKPLGCRKSNFIAGVVGENFGGVCKGSSKRRS